MLSLSLLSYITLKKRMAIYINIAYRTNLGEELRVNVLQQQSKDLPQQSTYPLTTNDGETWRCTLHPPRTAAKALDYYYTVVDGGKVLRAERRHAPHHLPLCGTRTQVVYDRWREVDDVAPLSTGSVAHTEAAPTDGRRQRQHGVAAPRKSQSLLRIKVLAPQLRPYHHLVMVGSVAALGAWDVQQGLPLLPLPHGEWTADIDSMALPPTCEYKFVAVDSRDETPYIWEDRYNRVLHKNNIAQGDIAVVEVEPTSFPIPRCRYAGTAVPVFSLRSEESFGVGDFGDVKKMIDFMARTGQRLLQLLPINDTTNTHTWVDSYPYCAISVFALHPQYIALSALPKLADKKKRQEFEALRRRLNALPQIDYEAVNTAKEAYLTLLFAQEGQRVLATAQYRAFFAENEEWLVPYAHYCALRDKKCHDVTYYHFVQFLLYTQMTAVHDYAQQRGVLLKGDIPIGVSREGCDVWQEPCYFNLQGQAGAPPDAFAVEGQNWGFPTYNWEEMRHDGCRWWQRRLTHMAKFFDAYRIDHVLGFFRIWEIPIDAVQGLLGQFVPALALTADEIEAYGLPFREALYTEPFITDHVLEHIFGEKATMVRDTFVEPSPRERFYHLREAYNTQRKIEKAFADKTSIADANLRDGLYALVSTVLFLRDHRDGTKYHPRIAAQYTLVYESLNEGEKAAFNTLYDDYFYHRNNNFWYSEAMNKLPKVVEATPMLPCAEDLGMVPACVPWVLNRLGILSLEIQSMPKDPSVPFGILAKNPYRSVCTISSHDTPTLRQWWDEDYARTQLYYNTVLGKYGAAPHPLPGALARDIVAQHLACPSMLCVLSLQDWLAIDEDIRLADANAERINIPANPKHYWRYRMHVPIEQLLADDAFLRSISTLIRDSGRE